MDPVQSWLDAKEVRRMAESLMAPPPEVDPTVLDAGYGDSFEGFANASSDTMPAEQPLPADHAQNAQRASVGSTLANARQVAEDSGMLSSPEPQGYPVPQPPVQPPVQPAFQPSVTSPDPVSVDPAREVQSLPTHSPFQVSTHQDLTEQVPMAREVAPPEPPQQPPLLEKQVTPPSAAPSFGRGVFSDVQSGSSRGPFLDRLHRFSQLVRQDFGASAMFLIDNDGQVILDEVENPKLIQVARTLANASYTASRQSAGSAAVGNLHVKISASATLEVVPVHSRYGLLVLGVVFAAPLGSERVTQLTSLLEQAVEPQD